MALKQKASTGKEQGRRPTNLLALDFASSGDKAVRLKKIKDHIVLAAIDILPPSGPDAEEKPVLPKPLAAYYTAVCATMENSVVRVFNQILPEEEDIEALVRENLSAAKDARVSGLVLSRARGKRESTVVPQQALFMMNSKVVLKSSSSWAKRLLARTDLDDAGRIALAYKTAYARPATGPEIGRAQSYLARFDSLLQANGVADAERKYQAWQALCQALMATSEFLTID